MTFQSGFKFIRHINFLIPVIISPWDSWIPQQGQFLLDQGKVGEQLDSFSGGQ